MGLFYVSKTSTGNLKWILHVYSIEKVIKKLTVKVFFLTLYNSSVTPNLRTRQRNLKTDWFS